MALKFDAPFLAILCVFSLELWHVHPLFKCNGSQLVDYALNTLTAKFHTPLGFSCLDLVWCGNTVSRLPCIPQTRLFNKHKALFNDCIHYYFSVTPTKARHVEKRNLRKELYMWSAYGIRWFNSGVDTILSNIIMFVFLGTVWWAATHMVLDLLVYYSQK